MPKFSARAVIFDLDGTLTPVTSPWRMVHEALGTWTRAKAYHDSFFAGGIDYDTWCRLDVSLWDGCGLEEVHSLIDRIKPVPEAIEILRAVASHRNGDGARVEMMILSSGFERTAEKVLAAAELGRERVTVRANGLSENGGNLVGVSNVALGDPRRNKRAHLQRFLDHHSIQAEEAVALDDLDLDRETFAELGAFIHVSEPGDLRKVYEYLG